MYTTLGQFGESRWTRAIFITIVVQAVLAIIFEAVIFSYHATQISIIDRERLDQKGYGLELTAAYANARSLLVYFILFMVAQVFTVGLVVDAVSTYIQGVKDKGVRLFLRIS